MMAESDDRARKVVLASGVDLQVAKRFLGQAGLF